MPPDDDDGDHDVDDGDGKDNDCPHICYYDWYKNENMNENIKVEGNKMLIQSTDGEKDGLIYLRIRSGVVIARIPVTHSTGGKIKHTQVLTIWG